VRIDVRGRADVGMAGPEHRYCNRATATHKAKRSRRTSYAFVDEQPCKVSRQW
jgi:hypothetical protein